ncbi:hypothetical protein HO173_010402 [Letharia columbiana]|uniref:Uncharacterized protein n=1 Tax=Letharia columbiana TaxID=112416 RepID=A0A8H6FMW4_9LECA|nr:uncharacterized protein HO173_010402 [Letharia columbiana]KAF6231441.1 hypothetical protein HO173_010402 [Letharia columbiana]
MLMMHCGIFTVSFRKRTHLRDLGAVLESCDAWRSVNGGDKAHAMYFGNYFDATKVSRLAAYRKTVDYNQGHRDDILGCAWDHVEPVHNFHAEDWYRAYTLLRWFWRKQIGARRANQHEGTSKAQINPAKAVEFYDPKDLHEGTDGYPLAKRFCLIL